MTAGAELILTRVFRPRYTPLNQQEKISMRNKDLITLLQEQDPEAEVMIRTSDGEYEYDPVDVTWDEEIECIIIQEG